MSQFDKSEIMTSYATALQEKSGINKYAWTSRDLTRALALDTAIMAPFAAGGAIGLGSGGVTGATGALTALVPVGTWGAGAATGGAAAGGLGAAIVSNPIGWIVGSILLVGGVAATIYFATEKADDNLTDLISRMEALDYEDTPAHARVQGWIDILKQKEKVFQLPELGNINDEEEMIRLANVSIEMDSVIRILDKIWGRNGKTWQETKKYLEDWRTFPFNDPKDFEEAFLKTYSTLKGMSRNIKRQSRRAQSSIMNPGILMQEIESLDAQITKMWAKPEYSPDELNAIKIGKNLVEKKTGLQQYGAAAPKLVSIRDQLRNDILPKAEKLRGKYVKSNQHPAISKRAVTLSDTPTAPDITGHPASVDPSKPIAKRRLQKSDTIETMQRQINDLSTALSVPIDGRLKEDGIYGPKTAQAVVILVGELIMKADPEKAPEQAKIYDELKRWGIVGDTITNVELMKSTPRYMNVLTNTVNNIYKIHVGQRQRPTSPAQQQQQQQKQTPDAWSKQQPNKQEILSELGKTYAMIGGTRTNLYDYARSSLGLSDDQIYRLINAKFPGMAPENWSTLGLVEALGARHSALS